MIYMKKAVALVLTLCMAVSLCGCAVEELIKDTSEEIIRDNVVVNSTNTEMAEAVAEFANFVRANPYPCGNRVPDERLMINAGIIREYSEHYAKVTAAGGEGIDSVYISYGQAVLRLEQYIGADEFILFVESIGDTLDTIAEDVAESRAYTDAREYGSASVALVKADKLYDELLKAAESTASSEPELRELIGILKKLEASVETEIDLLLEKSFMDVLSQQKLYDELLNECGAYVERADKYVEEILAIESVIAELSAKLK